VICFNRRGLSSGRRTSKEDQPAGPDSEKARGRLRAFKGSDTGPVKDADYGPFERYHRDQRQRADSSEGVRAARSGRAPRSFGAAESPRATGAADRQPTADSPEPRADSRQPKAYSPEPRADSRQPTADSPEPTRLRRERAPYPPCQAGPQSDRKQAAAQAHGPLTRAPAAQSGRRADGQSPGSRHDL
jgi:hypothetical protein